MCTGMQFGPKTEERLMGVVHALLHRIFKLPYSAPAEVPANVKKELSSESSLFPKTSPLRT